MPQNSFEVRDSAPTQHLPPLVGAEQSADQQTNTLAIVSFLTSWVLWPVGIVTGHIALSQIRKRGGGGRGLAITGTVIGYVLTTIAVLGVVMSLVISSLISRAVNTAIDRVGDSVVENFKTPKDQPEPGEPGSPAPLSESPLSEEDCVAFLERLEKAGDSIGALSNSGELADGWRSRADLAPDAASTRLFWDFPVARGSGDLLKAATMSPKVLEEAGRVARGCR